MNLCSYKGVPEKDVKATANGRTFQCLTVSNFANRLTSARKHEMTGAQLARRWHVSTSPVGHQGAVQPIKAQVSKREPITYEGAV